MIADTIQKQIGDAMKARDEIRLSTLKLLLSSLNYEKIAKQHELSEEEELSVVRREAKKRQDAIEVYEKISDRIVAQERMDKETQELRILEEFLPAQMSDEDLEKLVDAAIHETDAKEIKDMGRVIGAVMAKAGGTADGRRVAEIAKTKLN